MASLSLRLCAFHLRTHNSICSRAITWTKSSPNRRKKKACGAPPRTARWLQICALMYRSSIGWELLIDKSLKKFCKWVLPSFQMADRWSPLLHRSIRCSSSRATREKSMTSFLIWSTFWSKNTSTIPSTVIANLSNRTLAIDWTHLVGITTGKFAAPTSPKATQQHVKPPQKMDGLSPHHLQNTISLSDQTHLHRWSTLCLCTFQRYSSCHPGAEFLDGSIPNEVWVRKLQTEKVGANLLLLSSFSFSSPIQIPQTWACRYHFGGTLWRTFRGTRGCDRIQ